MPTISKCPSCGSERLLEGKTVEWCFSVPEPVFRFTFGDVPHVSLDGVATACLDCGTVIAQAKADPLELQKTAAKWMSDEAKKKALRLE